MSEKLELCIVLGPFLPPPPGPAGAVERRWIGTAKEWVRSGHRVTVICREPDRAEDRPSEDEGIHYLMLPREVRTGSTVSSLLRDLRYSLRARPLVPKTGVVVTNTFFLPMLLRGKRAKPTNRLLCINVARFPKGSGHLRRYRHVDRLLAVSTAIREAIQTQYPPLLSRTRVVANPIETGVFRMSEQAGVKDQEPPVLLYTGRIHPEKGIELLLDASAALVRTHPRLLVRVQGEAETSRGGGGGGYVRALFDRAAAAGVELEVAPANYDRACLAETLRGCDVYVYPSVAERGESFGVAPLEAMAVGCPTVVSNLSCFREFADHEKTAIVFDHRSPAAVENLTEAIGGLLADPEAARRLGKRAAERAAGFSYASVAARYIEVFEEAAADAGT